MPSPLPGPDGPISYTRDAWGYPTITARNELEGVWARGYLHALDRPLQVTLTLMAGQGRLMEVLGDLPFTRVVDRATRSLGLVHDLDDQVAAMSEPARKQAQIFSDGFNAGLKAGGWPMVARLLGLERLNYAPRDVC